MGEQTDFIVKSKTRWQHKLKYVVVGSFATSMEASLGGLMGASIGWLTIQHAFLLALATAGLTALRRAFGFLSVEPVPPIEQGEDNSDIKKLLGIVMIGLTLLWLTGCAFNRTAVITDHFDPNTGKLLSRDKRTFTSSMWAQSTALKGLKAHNHTDKTGADLSISEASNETQAEVMAAMVQAAVTGAVKGAKP
jgi:hypothetical protein